VILDLLITFWKSSVRAFFDIISLFFNSCTNNKLILFLQSVNNRNNSTTMIFIHWSWKFLSYLFYFSRNYIQINWLSTYVILVIFLISWKRTCSILLKAHKSLISRNQCYIRHSQVWLNRRLVDNFNKTIFNNQISGCIYIHIIFSDLMNISISLPNTRFMIVIKNLII